MYAIDTLTGLDAPKLDSPKAGRMAASPAGHARAGHAISRTDAALAIAKAHFIAHGWRPLAIHPPALERRCEDVSALLLMNDAGATAWLSARDWSALANPVDAFRREMVCVRAARVNETILVYDGEFPDNVLEVAACEPSLKLIDAAALRSMSSDASLSVAAAAAAAAMAPTRTQRSGLARPARQAAHYLARVMDTRPLAAAERYFHERFANRLRQLNGERRRLKALSTAMLILAGASFGFLAFNMVVLLSAPDIDETASRTAQVDAQPLPQPMPPPQGYVAQAAGVSGVASRSAYASPYRMEATAKPMRLMSAAPTSDGADASLAIATDAGAANGYEDVVQSQGSADDAIQVIAASTREVHAPDPPASNPPALVPTNAPATAVPYVRPADPTMADSESSLPDPAKVD